MAELARPGFSGEIELKLVKDIAEGLIQPLFLPIYFEVDSFNGCTEDYHLVLMIKTRLTEAFQANECLYEDDKIKGFVENFCSMDAFTL